MEDTFMRTILIAMLTACSVSAGPQGDPGDDGVGTDGGVGSGSGSGSGSGDPAALTLELDGHVIDEAADVIDLATGEPIHTHGGPVIALDSFGCPEVRKHAYLMDATAPKYG